jgi:predicted N-acetyltransferase YhbS
MAREDIDRILAAWYQGIYGGRPRKTYTGLFDEQERGLRTVIIAERGGEIAGCVSLSPSAKTGPFKGKGIPEITNLSVGEEFREQGVGTELMNRAEAAAAEMSGAVCLGVGLHGISGAAQRLFVKRGYIPDGSGVWYGRSPVWADATIQDVGGLTLYMSKELR